MRKKDFNIPNDNQSNSVCQTITLQLKYSTPVIDKRTGKEKHETDPLDGTLGAWRNGLAIFQTEYVDYLITKDLYIKYKSNYNTWIDENGKKLRNTISRIWGGYYVLRDWHCKVLATYPGQDRETKCCYYIDVEAILDENGRRLSLKEMSNYLKHHKIRYCTDLGNNLVFCDNSVYDVKDYSLIFSFNKEVIPLGYFNDGRCKLSVISDYRDFIVVVKNKIVKSVFDVEQFENIARLFNDNFMIKDISHERKYKANYDYDIIDNLKENEIEIVRPKIDTIIKKYFYEVAKDYDYDMFADNFYYVNKKWKCLLFDSESLALFDKVDEMNNNAPNFITHISQIDNRFVNKKVKLFLFKCRPFGFLNEDGTFDYKFDVNNIKW